jgi:hypothetical protein
MNPQASGPWIASGGLFVVGWLTVSAAFYASPWALVLLVLLIPEAMAVRALSRASKPVQTMAVPVIGAVVWFLAVFAGATWLGWGG